MGQCEPKERGFKQSFKEGSRSKILKNCEEKVIKNQDREKEAMRIVHLQWSIQHT
jgi:hypothetical protein